MLRVLSSPNQVEWERSDSPIPANSYYDGTRLVLSQIRRVDQGRYVCRARYPNGVTSQNYVDVKVHSEYRRKRHNRRARPVRHPGVY